MQSAYDRVQSTVDGDVLENLCQKFDVSGEAAGRRRDSEDPRSGGHRLKGRTRLCNASALDM